MIPLLPKHGLKHENGVDPDQLAFKPADLDLHRFVRFSRLMLTIFPLS